MSGTETSDQSPFSQSAPSNAGLGLGQTRHARFASMDVSLALKALARLHEQVSFGQGRVEIKRHGSEHVCVMISKSELEALETALEILTDTPEYRSMCETLSQVAAATGGYAQA